MFTLYAISGSFFSPRSDKVGDFDTAADACAKALELGADYVTDGGFTDHFVARSMDERHAFAIKPYREPLA